MFLAVDDGEVLALDMAFPTMGHDPKQPLYMVLHGLNGGSQEEYVRDFTERRLQEGSTVVVMIARGYVQSDPIQSIGTVIVIVECRYTTAYLVEVWTDTLSFSLFIM